MEDIEFMIQFVERAKFLIGYLTALVVITQFFKVTMDKV